ncbi:hypothetical protein L873DRAFT_1762558, partial [Choiromyces venosus 120613-1]
MLSLSFPLSLTFPYFIPLYAPFPRYLHVLFASFFLFFFFFSLAPIASHLISSHRIDISYHSHDTHDRNVLTQSSSYILHKHFHSSFLDAAKRKKNGGSFFLFPFQFSLFHFHFHFPDTSMTFTHARAIYLSSSPLPYLLPFIWALVTYYGMVRQSLDKSVRETAFPSPWGMGPSRTEAPNCAIPAALIS